MASTGSNSNDARGEAPAAPALAVGILTFQDADTIAQLSVAVREGLVSNFDGVPCRIMVSDSGSTDNTLAALRSAFPGDSLLDVSPPDEPVDLRDAPYHGVPRKARALRSLLTAARDLRVQALVILDGAVATISPRWIEWMARPVLEHGCDFVSPYFHRHPFEGALTKGLVYPVIRALYGVQVRQPAATEFACSGRLVEHLLEEHLWEREAAHVGVDVWLGIAAATADFRLAEASLGIRANHSRDPDAVDLPTTVAQVVGAVFNDVEQRAAYWQRRRGSRPVLRLGAARRTPPPKPAAIDVDALIHAFRLGYRDLRDVWTWVLPPRTIVDLRRLNDGPASQFKLDDALWARIAYDFALGYRLRVLARDHLLRSLVPLYSAWLASFVLQVRDLGVDGADERVETLAAAFEAQKPYLISRWRWPERLRVG